MSQKMYFLAYDKQGNADLWWTDGTTTEAVGGISDLGVANTTPGGLGPDSLTVFGQEMIFGGADSLATGSSNGLWLTDGTPGGTTEVGGPSPGTGKASPFINGSPTGLAPTGFVTFGSQAIFFGTDASDFTGLWVTNGAPGGTSEIGGLENGQIFDKGTNLSPENLAAFNNQVLFDAYDSSGGGVSYKGLWITDGTTGGTLELGGLQNQGIFDSGTTSFIANNFITLGGWELFDAPNAEGDDALWVTDGTANGTVEIGGMNNAGIVGADNTDLGDGLAQATQFGDRIFFSGNDNNEALGLWTTDGTANGTTEVGGLSDLGLTAYGQHPGLNGLNPTNLAVNGQQVLFNGEDTIGYKELWASDGTAAGTYEIGGEGVGGTLPGEAVNGLDPNSITSLGNGLAVFIGYDDSNNQASGKPTLWVTNGTFAGTYEIGGINNLGVGGISSTGFSFTSNLIGADGLAYFTGADSQGNQVLWETNGTLAGTKIDTATDGNAPMTGIVPFNMALGPVPAAANGFSGGGQTIALESLPGEEANLSNTANVWDEVIGSNGSISLNQAEAYVVGGGVLISLVGAGDAVALLNTGGNRDSIYGDKGAGVLYGAQANVFGYKDTITFAPGTTGNVVYLYDTQNIWDTVNGSDGLIVLTSAQVQVVGGGDTIEFAGGSGNAASLFNTNGNWDYTYGYGGTIYLTSAQVWVNGGGNTADFAAGSGDAALFNDTGGFWDTTEGANGLVYLNNAQAVVYGAGTVVDFIGSGDAVIFASTGSVWDSVNGSNGAIYLNSALAVVNGGGDSINFVGSGNAAILENTGGVWDNTSGANGVVYLNSAQVVVSGGGTVVDFAGGSGDAVIFDNTGSAIDTTNGSNGAIYLNNAQALANGGGNSIDFVGSGNAAILNGTGANWDSTASYSSAIYLNNADDIVYGGGNAVSLTGTSMAWIGTPAASDAFLFQPGIGGNDVIYNFDASDFIQLSASNFATWNALSPHINQSGANTVITLDAADSIILAGVTKTNLAEGQFILK